ncbi:Protein PYRICULARIA ORYZAE RESISTANCE 21 like [Actinidia chinensis var. chinensis]|uniref:Protein PYRICULARIA ORYZAE RESISTANCE 21 like n=1 Tax=Actinidia chinensis var. chinensis TaxID=1590841 RepID=A0A2R6RV03_ACTCC|nr:Protein PYRICULARIA ORYZAE RESISTANCE 21 like [Actinidia chinensis var. chinensis]
MSDEVTTMVLKVVDLQCHKCYKKIKNVLCKFPEIRNQAYDEKANTVTITVVCCNPEKMREKLCCKGGKTIKSIEIIKKPKPEPKPEPKPDPHPRRVCCWQCYEVHYGGPCYQGYGMPVPCYAGGCGCGCGYRYCQTKICYEENTPGCTIM